MWFITHIKKEEEEQWTVKEQENIVYSKDETIESKGDGEEKKRNGTRKLAKLKMKAGKSRRIK